MEHQGGYMEKPILKTPFAHLKQFTTFQLGGPCRQMIECHTDQQLIQTIQTCHDEGQNFVILGGGSNVVVSDKGLDCIVIRYYNEIPHIKINADYITVSACSRLDDLALHLAHLGYDGLNFTSGIPGTVAGAVIGNAGAWGQQVGDLLHTADILDPQGHRITALPDYFQFAYRHSRLKYTKDIVLNVTFKISGRKDPQILLQERDSILHQRHEKHPQLHIEPCAGSFFRNVEPTSKADRRQAAGWFLEQAGGKSLQVNGAYIFPKHANIIIKGPQGTAQDVYDLHLAMIKKVKDNFGFELEREVRFIGAFQGVEHKDDTCFW